MEEPLAEHAMGLQERVGQAALLDKETAAKHAATKEAKGLKERLQHATSQAAVTEKVQPTSKTVLICKYILYMGLSQKLVSVL